MSFLGASSGLEVGERLFFRLDELPNVFSKIFSTIRKVFDSFSGIVRKLSIMHKSLETHEVWTYRIDEETGIRILDVERDELAIDKTRNALQDLFL
jgi:hypothetical protein